MMSQRCWFILSILAVVGAVTDLGIDFTSEKEVKRQIIRGINNFYKWKLKKLGVFDGLRSEYNDLIDLSETSKQHMAVINSDLDVYSDGAQLEFQEIEALVEQLEEELPEIFTTISSPAPLPPTTEDPRPDWWYKTNQPPPEIAENIGNGFDGYYTSGYSQLFDHAENVVFDNVTLDTLGGYNLTDGGYKVTEAGVYLIFIQMDSSDDYPSVFDVFTKDGWTQETRKIADIVTGVSQSFTFLSTYLVYNDKLYVGPDDIMDGFISNVKAGPQSRLSIFNMRDRQFAGVKG